MSARIAVEWLVWNHIEVFVSSGLSWLFGFDAILSSSACILIVLILLLQRLFLCLRQFPQALIIFCRFQKHSVTGIWQLWSRHQFFVQLAHIWMNLLQKCFILFKAILASKILKAFNKG